MSGKRISRADRRIIVSQRRYVSRIRESMTEPSMALTVATDKALRDVQRIGK